MFFKNLLERLRGKKPSAKEILQRHKRQMKSTSNSLPNEMTLPPNPLPEPTSPPVTDSEVFVLDIRNQADMNDYLQRLKNLKAFEEFLSLSWLKTRLDRVNKILAALETLKDFDNEEFNSKLADKVRAITLNMLSIYRDAKTTPSLNETARDKLRATVDNYLASIGLTKKIFNVGDPFDDWADLGMKDSYEVTYTDNRDLNSTIAVIDIQPHIIFYRGDSDEPEQLIFGGSCRVYKFKED